MLGNKFDQEVANFWDRESRNWGDKYRNRTSYFYRCRIFQEFFRATGLEQASILDYGCGSGDISFPLLQEGHSVTGVDIAAGMVWKARARAEAHGLASKAVYHYLNDKILADITSRKFDIVICSSVLEYVEDDMSLAKMFHSVLSDDGFLLVSIPDRKSLCCKLDKWIYSHKRLMPGFVPIEKVGYLDIQKRQYDIKQFINIFEETGFTFLAKKHNTMTLQRGFLMEKISNISGMGMLAIMLFQKSTAVRKRGITPVISTQK